jgi:transcriptional pleiotropic regulator of transition state genes
MLKSTGIVRKVDDLGRVVLPKELRNTLGIDQKDPIEIFVDGDRIVLKKYEPGCVMCDNVNDTQLLHGKLICATCIQTASGKA